jgi:endo-1,4-beta-xylanase
MRSIPSFLPLCLTALVTFAAACGSEGDTYPVRMYVPPGAGGTGAAAPAPSSSASGSGGVNPDTALNPPLMMPSAMPTTLPPAGGAPGTLRDAAGRTQRLIGVALQARLLNDTSYTTAAKEFSSVTAENEMKWNSVERQPNVFNFGNADRIVAFAEQNAMQVRGHTLVWHSQLPGWVSQLTTPEAVRSAMLNHINTVMAHYKGRVFSWDVVNEAWEDNGMALRASVFQQQLGDRYIDEAFIAARAADPDAKLYYNDYGTEGMSRKANSVFTMVQGMLERGVPIDGVGMQMHVTNNPNGPTAQQFAQNMQRLVDLGLEVNISELDISTCGTGTEAERLVAQGERAYGLVQACMNQAACNFITVWGVSDQYSWRDDCQEGGDPLALLWSNAYAKKPAYTRILDALMGR